MAKNKGKGSVMNHDAISYEPTLRRLEAAFSLKPGDLITHEQIEAVVQCEGGRRSSRYRGILSAWIKRVWREKRLELSGKGRARGIGLAVSLGQEQSAFARQGLIEGHRKIRRSQHKVDAVDTAGFSEKELAEHNLTRRAIHAAAEGLQAAKKELRGPPKVSESNVRLLKLAE